jgi:hypothetical protein
MNDNIQKAANDGPKDTGQNVSEDWGKQIEGWSDK